VVPSESAAVPAGTAAEATSAIEPAATEAAGTVAATEGTEAAATEPAGTEAAGTAAVAEDTTPMAPAGTEPMGTEAAGTEPAGTEAPAAQTTGPPEIVASREITLEPLQVWEQPASGPACGPTTVAVTYTPRDRALANAVVVWAGSFGIDQSPMEIVDNIATATIGPFPAHTVGTEIIAEPLSVIVVAIGTDGTVAVLQPERVELTLTACPT
jgi:hypothetical protein